uniref:Uncharacterized protein n=1 Tax=Oryza glumipatula TaxID=40148 RepID=A0A0D9YA50_9ORYZ
MDWGNDVRPEHPRILNLRSAESSPSHSGSWVSASQRIRTHCHDHELHDADGRSIPRKAIAHGFFPM